LGYNQISGINRIITLTIKNNMTRLKPASLVFCLFILCISLTTAFAQSADDMQVDIVAIDPADSATLGNDEKLYVKVRYETEIPVRFQAIAMREGSPLEVGAIKNPAALHAPGAGEALAWVMYLNPTHVDAVRIVVLDEAWQPVYQLSHVADVTWQGVASAQPRKPAEWVPPLIKAELRKIDYLYDPAPQRYGVLFDILFFLNLAAIPVYVLLQLHMLWRYRYRWRELAVIPIFPYIIVGFYVVAGLEIETSFLVTFLFRYTLCALLWLVLVWLAKRFWQHKLPPPKLYKPPKD
jgi:hypothetical protein